MEKRNVYELFKNQSQKGNGYASWKLSVMHSMGRGCERSEKLSLRCLELSSRQGCALGIRDLANAVLQGRSQAMTIADAHEKMLSLLREGVCRLPAEVLLGSGQPKYEKAALQALKIQSVDRASFRARAMVAIHQAAKSAVPISAAESWCFLRELSADPDKKTSLAARRALLLADSISLFFWQRNHIQIIASLLDLEHSEAAIDAFELAEGMRGECPMELKHCTSRAISALAMNGNLQAKVITLCQIVVNSGDADVVQSAWQQLQRLIEKNPQYVNDYVLDTLEHLQEYEAATIRNGEPNADDRWTRSHLEMLKAIDRPDLQNIRVAIVSTLLRLGQSEQAYPLMLDLINHGNGAKLKEFVELNLEKFKRREIDAETALFWAECFQQDNPTDGLAAVTAVYDAMGAQNGEHKLAHVQVLEERSKNGDFVACTDLALLLLSGSDVVLANKKRAFELFSRAAEGGHPRAMYHLGLCYVRGVGTHVDDDLGHFWISKGASHGYSRAELKAHEQERSGNSTETPAETSDAQTGVGQQIRDLIAFKKQREEALKSQAVTQLPATQEGA